MDVGEAISINQHIWIAVTLHHFPLPHNVDICLSAYYIKCWNNFIWLIAFICQSLFVLSHWCFLILIFLSCIYTLYKTNPLPSFSQWYSYLFPSYTKHGRCLDFCRSNVTKRVFWCFDFYAFMALRLSHFVFLIEALNLLLYIKCWLSVRKYYILVEPFRSIRIRMRETERTSLWGASFGHFPHFSPSLTYSFTYPDANNRFQVPHNNDNVILFPPSHYISNIYINTHCQLDNCQHLATWNPSGNSIQSPTFCVEINYNHWFDHQT